MPHPTSQARAARALRRAISLTPSPDPLCKSLQLLSNPLSYHSDLTHLDEATWQSTFNHLTTFAETVIKTLESGQGEQVLPSLNDEAVKLHSTLDRTGFYTSFFPSHITARSLSTMGDCADSSEQTLANMRIVSTSFPATFECLQHIFKTPANSVDPVGTLCKVADRHRFRTPPSSSAIVPLADKTNFESLNTSCHQFMSKLNRVPIPEPGRKRVRSFVDLLWKQAQVPHAKLHRKPVSSALHLNEYVGASDLSIVMEGILDFADESIELWSTAVMIKSLRVPPKNDPQHLVVRLETLRLKILCHPCIPLFYGVICPAEREGTSSHNILLVTERMTHSIRSARKDPALRPFDSRIRILRDLADALRYLHLQQVSHDSISPENVLVRVDNNRLYGHAKLDITGLTLRALGGRHRRRPLVYRPPESFSGGDHFFTGDVWSFGVLACFLLTNEGNEENDDAFCDGIVTAGKIGSVANKWARRVGNERARDLVIRCLHPQPERRPNAEDVYVDISSILREKSVKADMLVAAASPSNLDPSPQRQLEEPAPKAQRTGSILLMPSSYSMKPGESASQIEKGPNAAGQKSGCVQMERSSNGPCTKKRESQIRQASNDTLESKEDGGYFREEDSPNESGLVDSFKFQVDTTDGTRCVKRRTSQKANPKPSKRPHVNQPRKTQGSPDITAGLRRATMEEIFGPFASNSSLCALKEPPKSENILENKDTVNEASLMRISKTPSKVKAEPIVTSDDQVSKAANVPSEKRTDSQGARNRNLHHVVNAKTEPTLEADNPKSNISAGRRPPARKREVRHQRQANRERRRSKSRGCTAKTKDYRPHEHIDATSSTVWKGRIRKRLPRSFKYADRSPSPAPSFSSRGVDSTTSCPSDSIIDIETNGTLLGMLTTEKGSRVVINEHNVRLEGQRGGEDHSKRKNVHPTGSSGTKLAHNLDNRSDPTLDFTEMAKEGESMLEFYTRVSSTGNPIALVRLGLLFEEGRHVRCDYGRAFSCYQRAASAGNSEGHLRLARCYEDGRGVSKNEPAAAALFIQAADAENANAQYRAGVCFEEGRGVVKDMKKSLYYLNKSVEVRVPEACHRVAGLCKDGKVIPKDEKRAFQLYKIASEAGHVPSMVQLAGMFAKGIGGTKRSLPKAVNLYRKASDCGNPNAKLALGLLHEDGQGVKKSSDCAFKLYTEASDAGYAPAITALGQCFLWGYGAKQDLRKAVEHFRSAAEQGDSLAQHELGNCYKDGSGVDQDHAKALHFYKKASVQDSSVALVQYGEFLYWGKGVAQDFEKAIEQFRRAAELGAAEGYRWLGECYTDGTGVKADAEKAFQMYAKGGQLGSSDAQTCLGVCYENGTGVEQSQTKALQWYRKAAAEGNQTAMNNLGIFYEQGRLVKKEPKRAVTYYQKAIDLGSVDALCNLADCYASGTGVTQDLKKAVQLYEDAAKYGMSGAKCELGVCYYHGKGVKKNFEKALDLFKDASKSEPEALRHLGTAFYDGKGVERDYKAAVCTYQKAIDKGNPDANYNLALCYSYGKGVPKDEKRAAVLLEIASNHGNCYAKLCLGNRYFEGRGVEKDIERAVKLFQEAEDVDLEHPLTDDRIRCDERQEVGLKSIV